jgi:Tfp pilus assembly protein PilX
MILSRKKFYPNDHGFILIGMIIMMLLLAVTALALNRRVSLHHQMAANQVRSMQIYLGQRAAIEHAKWKLKQDDPLWRTSSSGEDYVYDGITYNRKVLDKTIPCEGKFIEMSVAVSEGTKAITTLVPPALTSSSGVAVWRQSASTVPYENRWDGSSFGTSSTTRDLGKWRIIAGAESPTEGVLGGVVVVGVDDIGKIRITLWNGYQWAEMPMNPLNTNDVSETYWWGCAVAYEQSGYAVVVFNNNTAGSMLQYYVGNNIGWWGAYTIAAYSGGEPQHMKIAAKPGADEMVLVVNDINVDDYALVWSGSDWGNAVLLDSSGTGEDDQTALYVAYEQQSGNAMVVYGKDNDANVYYRIWDGLSWGLEGTITPPLGITSQTRWLTLASDPNTNRIVLGVLASGAIWLSVWDGTLWEEAVLAEATEASTVCPNMAVAFESKSGKALATYGESGQSVVRFRTWNGCDWSEEQNGPDIGAVSNSMMLDSDPESNDVMLSVQNANSELFYVLWNGQSWDTPSMQEDDTGEVKNQPFLFLYDQS